MAGIEEFLVRARNTLPEPVLRFLKGTSVDTFYTNLKKHTMERKSVVIETSEGVIELDVPKSSNFGEGGHEPLLVSKISELVDSETTYYDVGAQYGFHSLVAQSAGCKDIHCFEADKLIFSVLEKNIVKGKINRGFVGRCGIDDICIDNYTSKTSPPDIVKIDVEGAELNVLKGMKDILEKQRPDLLIELHPKLIKNFGDNIQEIRDLLTEYGYKIQCFDHRKEELSELEFEEASQMNNFAIHCQPT